MNKKLNAKTQELNPKLPQYSNSFSQSIVIKPENQELLLKKGTVYTVFSVSGESNFDTELITKVITDVLHDAYFESESISPIQSMEKAIVETKNKVTQLSSDALTSNAQTISLNITSGILWGNVLYVVQFGNGKIYTMKEGAITLLNTISEGNFSTASKVVNEEDILIICTDAFVKIFPPEKLMSLSISEGQLQPNQTCLLMRLIIDTTLSEDEEIDFGLKEVTAKSKARQRAQKITDFAKSGIDKTFSMFKKGAEVVKPVSGKVKEVVKNVKFPKLPTNIQTPRLAEKKKDVGPLVGVLALSGVLLAGGIYILITTPWKSKEDIKEEVTVVEEPSEEVVEEPKISEEEQKALDEKAKVERVTPEIFYDLKITESTVEPSELVSLGSTLASVDRSSGKVFASDISSPSFSAKEQVFSGIKSLANNDGILSFSDNEGYKTFDVETLEVGENYSIEDIDLSFPYSGFIYIISNDILTRHSKENGELSGSTWGQNPDFVNSKSMAINFEIYILTKDNRLVSFSGGEKTNFSVTGLEEGFKNPTKVVFNFDSEHIYIADTGNNSVVILDTDGNLVKQYKHTEESMWGDIRSIAVSPDETSLFVLNSSKIYKVDLSFE
ncbi:MAG: hypothetical protein ABIA11_00080 [Patescibacteria group bacterium]